MKLEYALKVVRYSLKVVTQRDLLPNELEEFEEANKVIEEYRKNQ